MGEECVTVLPSVQFNAVLKSGSSYITDMLVRGLIAKRCFITVGVFPDDLILFEKIQGFAAGGQVAQQHFPASPENLAYLEKFDLPLIIHGRDPRAVIVSWTHHLASAKGGLDELFWYYPAICTPASFLGQPFAWQFDWCLENHFPQFLAWLDGWRTAAERGRVTPLFTTFEEFLTDRARFFDSLLQQAGIPNSAFEDPVASDDQLACGRAAGAWRGLLSRCDEAPGAADLAGHARRFGLDPLLHRNRNARRRERPILLKNSLSVQRRFFIFVEMQPKV